MSSHQHILCRKSSSDYHTLPVTLTLTLSERAPPPPNPTISPPSLRVFACQMGNALLRVVHGSWTRVMIQCINTSLVIWCDWCADVWWSWCSIWGQFNILASFTSWYDNLEQTRRKFLPPFPTNHSWKKRRVLASLIAVRSGGSHKTHLITVTCHLSGRKEHARIQDGARESLTRNLWLLTFCSLTMER